MKNKNKLWLGLLTIFGAGFSYGIGSEQTDNGWVDVIDSPHRAEQKIARDGFRHPLETLQFFGFRSDMTVVEIWPGAGWYTDILAPALKEKGHLIAAHFDPDAGVKFYSDLLENYQVKLKSNPELYGKPIISVFNPPEKTDIAPENSVDMVLTFRNIHNWFMRGDEQAVEQSFATFFKALKPGGVLGVVEHRLPADRDKNEQKKSGYMHQAAVIQWAKAAGFQLVATSEINANPNDNANHPKGVWTLPPRLMLGDQDREKYLKIGESDRMTLKFIKPADK